MDFEHVEIERRRHVGQARLWRVKGALDILTYGAVVYVPVTHATWPFLCIFRRSCTELTSTILLFLLHLIFSF